jgi:hypothetical protein
VLRFSTGLDPLGVEVGGDPVEAHYLLIAAAAPVIVALCSTVRWALWVRFNRWHFLQTKDPKAFEQAAKVAESYRHFAAPSLGRQPGASAIETRAKEPAREASEEPP